MKSESMTLRDALLGGPGLDGYAYCADTYCVDCGRDITLAVYARRNGRPIPYPEAQDSDEVPQPIFFGDADYAVHCSDCGEHLYGEDDES